MKGLYTNLFFCTFIEYTLGYSFEENERLE
jgi:hypothetical protein